MFAIPQRLCGVPRRSVRPLAARECGDSGNDIGEGLFRAWVGGPGAYKAMRQPRLLDPASLSAGRHDAVAIGLAVRGQRIVFSGDDDSGRQTGEIAGTEWRQRWI